MSDQKWGIRLGVDTKALRDLTTGARKIEEAARLIDSLRTSLSGIGDKLAGELTKASTATSVSVGRLKSELAELKGVEQIPPHVQKVWEHTLSTVSQLDLNLVALKPEYNPESASDLLQGLLKRGKLGPKLRVIGPPEKHADAPHPLALLRSKLAEFGQRIKDCDVVILSDYGKGGLAWQHSDIDMAINNSESATYGPTNARSSANFTQLGWTLGGGLEYMFVPNWSAKAWVTKPTSPLEQSSGGKRWTTQSSPR